MKPFDYYLKNGEVKKASVDSALSESLIKDMKDRISKVDLLDINIFPKIIYENVYDALRAFCDAVLAAKGFKSYSHSASIAYLDKFGFDVVFVGEFDQFRCKRNSSKYYGHNVSVGDAKAIKEFFKENEEKINEVIGGL